MDVVAVVARARNGVIGRNGMLPWSLPADLAHFKRLTMGHPLIMGRRTFDSLPGILPGRPHFVLSRRPDWSPSGVFVCASLDAALAQAREQGARTAFVIGGATVYVESLTVADRVVMTHVHADVDGDVYVPQLDPHQWRKSSIVAHPADARHTYAFEVCTYERAVPKSVGFRVSDPR